MDTSDDGGTDLVLRLVAPRRARAGARVRLVLHATNATAALLELTLRGHEPVVDVEVARDGVVAWHRLAGAAIPMVARLVALAPAESLVVPVTWDGRGDDGHPLAPGDWELRARLLVDVGALEAPPVVLRVVPRG